MAHDQFGRPLAGRRGAEHVAAPVIASLTGSTPGGMPLALSRSPRASLRPWVMWIGVTDVTLLPGDAIVCGTFSEHPVIRIIFGSRWSAHTADGDFDYEPGEDGLALYFGPTSRRMPLVAHGSFRTVTINCVPGACSAFDLPPQPETVDRIYRFDPIVGRDMVLPGYRPQPDMRGWLDAVGDQLEAALAAASPMQPGPLMAAFETMCLIDPGGSLERFASDNGVSRRTLERTIKREWGVSPGEALRRARALDMASILLGVALEEEEQDLRLRYFDQSHLIREMRHFFDCTPGKLMNDPHPLLCITMEIRQSRRVEALKRIGAEDPRPWRDPRAEPVAGANPNRKAS